MFSSPTMPSVRKSAVVLLLCLVLVVGNGEERPTFRERAMQIARRISRYQEQLQEFAKTVQNVNLVSVAFKGMGFWGQPLGVSGF